MERGLKVLRIDCVSSQRVLGDRVEMWMRIGIGMERGLEIEWNEGSWNRGMGEDWDWV